MSDRSDLRDLIPEASLQLAQIRSLLDQDHDLGSWSRSHPRAIRPHRLAMLIRRCIWEAHDLQLSAVRKRIKDSNDGTADFRVSVAVDVGGRDVLVDSHTRFDCRTGNRICADMELKLGGAVRRITSGSIRLDQR